VSAFMYEYQVICRLTAGLVVINQMDTSQSHLGAGGSKSHAAKDPAKPENLTKDELTAVLKYGAQKMCVGFANLPIPCSN
jgi:hypothetical protein